MEGKLALPSFLKLLTNHNVPASKAMAVAGKIYKTHNTPSLLAQLTDAKLSGAGVEDKETRRLVLAAIRKAGYTASTRGASGATGPSGSTPSGAGVRSSSAASQSERPKKKRKRDDDLNEFLPDHPPDEGAMYGSLEFNEILDEEPSRRLTYGCLFSDAQILKPKFTVVNRAPIMMAWAFVVAERLGFQREEALSIASVYTEMNAISKGVSLGIFDKNKSKGVDASPSGTQPYVDLMGRRGAPSPRALPGLHLSPQHVRVPLMFGPLYQTASGGWRALSSGSPVAPTSAFSYITRALRQTAPPVLGALRLLAASYTPVELNRDAFALYAEFRPSVEEWGQRGETRCATILDLRKAGTQQGQDHGQAEDGSARIEAPVKVDSGSPDGVSVADAPATDGTEQEPASKKQRSMTLEEYEAALDDDHMFDSVDLNFDNVP
ncbi:uncharacterized protein FIBRA_05305 [Fibroporia radiculosa]|uniref:Uncharacterized protein n=1 Tax=Fibroporia radiculosa TaxID=599839 RepID=J4G919_9APHY|nr:uncharacterized protein FIBRA_05305 [Fibroporia radiculosa]CCM03183.1 predicted protein [Fibroporia radiculosa]